jgi:hypothetical protein
VTVTAPTETESAYRDELAFSIELAERAGTILMDR